MIESGFSDEESYLEYLLDKHDEEQEQIDISDNLNKKELSAIEYQDYIEIIRNNKIYTEVNEVLSNTFLHSRMRFYKVKNCFLDKYPTKFFYKILNTEGTKYGYCDSAGKTIIPCIYDKINLVEQGIAIVLNNEKYFCININNKQITPILEGQTDWPISKQLIISQYEQNRYKGAVEIELESSHPYYKTRTLINNKGLMVRIGYERYAQLPAKYTFVYYLYSDLIPLIPVKSEGKWGFINRKLLEIIPCEYEAFDYSYDNDYIKLITGKPHHCFSVMKGGDWIVFDENGNLLAKLK